MHVRDTGLSDEHVTALAESYLVLGLSNALSTDVVEGKYVKRKEHQLLIAATELVLETLRETYPWLEDVDAAMERKRNEVQKSEG